MVLLLVLDEVLADGTEDSSADGSKEPVVGFTAQDTTANSTTKSSQQASIGLIHGRSIGIVVGGVGVAGLGRKLMLVGIGILLAALLTPVLTPLTHLLLIGLVLSVGIIAAVALLLLLLLLTVISRMALWVAGIVRAVLPPSLAMLEASVLWRAERVLAPRRAIPLVLRRVALLRILLLLLATFVALLGRIATAVALLRGLAVVRARVRIVGTRHGGSRT